MAEQYQFLELGDVKLNTGTVVAKFTGGISDLKEVIEEHRVAYEAIKKDSEAIQINSTTETTKIECEPKKGKCRKDSSCDHHGDSNQLWCYTDGPNSWSTCRCTKTKVNNTSEQVLLNTQIQNGLKAQISTLGIMMYEAEQKFYHEIPSLLGGDSDSDQGGRQRRNIIGKYDLLILNTRSFWE